MKKIVILLGMFAFIFAVVSCGGPQADAKKIGKLMCEMEQLQEKMMDADADDIEKIQKEVEKLWEKFEKIGEDLEAKYDEDDPYWEEFYKEIENYEC